MDEAYFRAQYAKDAANRAKQSEKDYLGWVARFYEGQRFPPVSGWAKREAELASRFPGARALVADVGRALAAEWAKDNAVRKVSTSDLRSWGGAFERAAKDEAGLVAALKNVQAELAKRGVIP